jgi:lysine-N-methylase
MAALRLELPVLQNWSCHNCGGCCRQHLIEVTEAERQRILAQNWLPQDGVNQPVMTWHAGPPWRKRYRLTHTSDGGCVFLDEKGLCRIHAKFGEAAKPLPCRIYPFAFHPAGKSFTVSLRFSCPSVVANKGIPVSQRLKELRGMAGDVIPPGAENTLAPFLTKTDRVDWTDFMPFVEALDHSVSASSAPLVVKIVRAITWTTLVGQSSFEKLRGPRIRELIGLLMEAARIENSSLPEKVDEPSQLGQLYFRTLVAQYARKDTVADLSSGLSGRWRLFRAILKFTRGQGDIPALQPGLKSVPFAALEGEFGGLDPIAEEILTRYFRVKIQGLHFCGSAYYDVPFAEGFHSLALMLPVTLWLARWLAVSEGRNRLTVEDISKALAIADHHHGYSPALAQFAARNRVRWLAESLDLPKLCFWYSR